MKRVAIVDYTKSSRETLINLLAEHPQLEVVATFSCIDSFLSCFEKRPLDSALLDTEISKINGQVSAKTISVSKINIKCFPNFNVYVKDKPITFKSHKAKEILAYLVYNKGGWVDINEICAEILADLSEEKAKDSFRSYFSRLKKNLELYGIWNLIEKGYGKCRVKTEMYECDYYEYLQGKTNLFTGEFLKSYTWAEPTQAAMQLETTRST